MAYTLKEIKYDIANLKNNRARGSYGIPGDRYKHLRKELNGPINTRMGEIKQGKDPPEECVQGAIAHI